MSTPAPEQHDFSDVAAQAVSNALYSHGAELERLQYKTTWLDADENRCVFALSRLDEHRRGDHYGFDISLIGNDVSLKLSYRHLGEVGETGILREDENWSSSESGIGITGNPLVDKQIITAKVIDLIGSWVLPD